MGFFSISKTGAPASGPVGRVSRRALVLGLGTACVGSGLTACSSKPAHRRSSGKKSSTPTPGPEAAPSYSSSPQAHADMTWDYFMPSAAPGPGTYVQQNRQLWAVYAQAGALTYTQDPSSRGAIPAAALSPGQNQGAFEKVQGEIISDVETSAARLGPTLAGQALTEGEVLTTKMLVNRYPDSVGIAAKVYQGAAYVYAVSTDTDHLFSATAKA